MAHPSTRRVVHSPPGFVFRRLQDVEDVFRDNNMTDLIGGNWSVVKRAAGGVVTNLSTKWLVYSLLIMIFINF